jgi:hypothetical protein
MRSSIALVAIVLACAPSAAPAGPSRFFANFPLIVDPTFDRLPFNFAAHHISQDSNAVALHMEWFGVPWREFAAGQNPPEAWLRQMDAIRGLEERLGLPAYLALTPIGGNRDRLAPSPQGTYALSTDDSFGARCEPIDTRPDYATVIRPGYQRYVAYMIQRFQPRFVALSIEVNMYAVTCPSAWPAMQRLLNETYDLVKQQLPGVPVFHTFQTEFLWQAEDGNSPCFGFIRDCVRANVQALASLKTDLYALSTYPAGTFVNNGRRLPDDYLTSIGTLSGKPLAISETGYPAITFSPQFNGICFPGLSSSSEDQAWWMSRVLRDAESANMQLVVWWSNEDLLPSATTGPCDCQDGSVWCYFLRALDETSRNALRGFGTMGLREFDGTPRPVAGSLEPCGPGSFAVARRVSLYNSALYNSCPIFRYSGYKVRATQRRGQDYAVV